MGLGVTVFIPTAADPSQIEVSCSGGGSCIRIGKRTAPPRRPWPTAQEELSTLKRETEQPSLCDLFAFGNRRSSVMQSKRNHRHLSSPHHSMPTKVWQRSVTGPKGLAVLLPCPPPDTDKCSPARRTLVVGPWTCLTDIRPHLFPVPRMCLCALGIHTLLPAHCYRQQHNPLVRSVTHPLPRYAQTTISPAGLYSLVHCESRAG